MALSEEQKKKIEEEERKKLEEEKYRENAKKKLNKTPWWKPKGKVAKIGLGILALWLIGTIFQGIFYPSGNKPANSQSVITEDYKNSLAQTYCDNRSNGYPYLDIQPIAESRNDVPNNTTKKPLLKDCKAIVELCLKGGSKNECENIASKKIWIGMNKAQLQLAWGNPKRANNSTYASGVHSQWVYGNYGKPYVYLEGKSEDDMKVTSWQD